MDHQKRVYNVNPKSHKNFKKNLDKFGAKLKEFWISKTLSHRIRNPNLFLLDLIQITFHVRKKRGDLL